MKEFCLIAGSTLKLQFVEEQRTGVMLTQRTLQSFLARHFKMHSDGGCL